MSFSWSVWIYNNVKQVWVLQFSDVYAGVIYKIIFMFLSGVEIPYERLLKIVYIYTVRMENI